MHTLETIAQLIQQGEGPTLELKVNTPHPENLSRIISGLANTDGGTVVVGVREPTTFLGTDIDRFKRFVQIAKTRLHGAVEVIDYSIDFDGKHLGIIEVKRAKIPVASKEGYFRRVGDREEALTTQQLVKMMTAVPDHSAAINSLSETISVQSGEIAKLRDSFEKANSWQRKAFYAFIGAAASAVIKFVLAAVGL